MLMKTIGLDQIILNVIERLRDVEQVFLVGDFAKGIDSPIIDLIIIGKIDKNYLITLVERAEELVKRKIRYLIYDSTEFQLHSDSGFANEALLLWSKDE